MALVATQFQAQSGVPSAPAPTTSVRRKASTTMTPVVTDLSRMCADHVRARANHRLPTSNVPISLNGCWSLDAHGPHHNLHPPCHSGGSGVGFSRL